MCLNILSLSLPLPSHMHCIHKQSDRKTIWRKQLSVSYRWQLFPLLHCTHQCISFAFKSHQRHGRQLLPSSLPPVPTDVVSSWTRVLPLPLQQFNDLSYALVFLFLFSLDPLTSVWLVNTVTVSVHFVLKIYLKLPTRTHTLTHTRKWHRVRMKEAHCS